RFTGPGNLTGLPALSVPCGFSQGLPVGLQFMGPAFGEAAILNAGYAFEKTNPLGGQKQELLSYFTLIRTIQWWVVLFLIVKYNIIYLSYLIQVYVKLKI